MPERSALAVRTSRPLEGRHKGVYTGPLGALWSRHKGVVALCSTIKPPNACRCTELATGEQCPPPPPFPCASALCARA